MIAVGQYNTLTILRDTSVGLYLGSEDEDVLLPKKYMPQQWEIGQDLEVFVYLDYEDRLVATNIEPAITLFDFALLRVTDVSKVGAFLDWGLEKDLLVPFKEQHVKMREDGWYLVYMDMDTKTDRLYASSKLGQFLSNDELTVAQGQEVELIVWERTDLGYSVIVNGVHKGLVFDSDVIGDLEIGQRLKGFIKNIRPDNKLDIALKPMGYANAIDADVSVVLEALRLKDGFLALTDKSDPEDIADQLGLSKKAYKRVLGKLYKDRVVSLESDGVRLTAEVENRQESTENEQKPVKKSGFYRKTD